MVRVRSRTGSPTVDASRAASDPAQRNRAPVLGRVRAQYPNRDLRMQAVWGTPLPVRGQVRRPLRLARVRPRDSGSRSSFARRGRTAGRDPVRSLRRSPRSRIRGREIHAPEHTLLRQLDLDAIPAQVGTLWSQRHGRNGKESYSSPGVGPAADGEELGKSTWHARDRASPSRKGGAPLVFPPLLVIPTLGACVIHGAYRAALHCSRSVIERANPSRRSRWVAASDLSKRARLLLLRTHQQERHRIRRRCSGHGHRAPETGSASCAATARLTGAKSSKWTLDAPVKAPSRPCRYQWSNRSSSAAPTGGT